jgi:hypothetical protein
MGQTHLLGSSLQIKKGIARSAYFGLSFAVIGILMALLVGCASSSKGSSGCGSNCSTTINLSTQSLSFSSGDAQTFTVSGGSGNLSETDNCSNVASLVGPSSGIAGTWSVSPVANGSCSITFADAIGDSNSVGVNVALSSGTSTLTMQMEEDPSCNNQTIYFKFFDETLNLVWPAPPNVYYFPDSNQVYSDALACTTGDQICYGGSFSETSEAPDYWGVGINNDEQCENCCYTCQTATTQVNDLSCNGDKVKLKVNTIENQDGRLLAPEARHSSPK